MFWNVFLGRTRNDSATHQLCSDAYSSYAGTKHASQNAARSLDHNLRDLPHMQCTDPRDRVFGVLGLVDMNRSSFRPDYQMSTPELFVAVTSQCRSPFPIQLGWSLFEKLELTLETFKTSSVDLSMRVTIPIQQGYDREYIKSGRDDYFGGFHIYRNAVTTSASAHPNEQNPKHLADSVEVFERYTCSFCRIGKRKESTPRMPKPRARKKETAVKLSFQVSTVSKPCCIRLPVDTSHGVRPAE